jgi:hypothetical protein
MRCTICPAEGFPLPPRLAGGWAVEKERSVCALRAHMSLREAGTSNSLVLTIIWVTS